MSGILLLKWGSALAASHCVGLDLFGFQAIPLVFHSAIVVSFERTDSYGFLLYEYILLKYKGLNVYLLYDWTLCELFHIE
jgi:hypothetical protein